MDLDGKEIIEEFYKNFYSDPEVISKYLHPQVELTWNSSSGLKTMKLDEISAYAAQMASSYDSLRIEIKDIIEENKKVVIDFTYFVTTMENPEEEIHLAHFMAIWKLENGQLKTGHQISQLAE